MSESHSAEMFRQQVRRCGIVFGAVVCITLMMVGASYAPVPNRALTIGMVLLAACVNAGLVAGFLMHLVSEKKTIYAVLAFTAVFFVGLMGLTIWATYDIPALMRG